MQKDKLFFSKGLFEEDTDTCNTTKETIVIGPNMEGQQQSINLES